MKKTFTIEVEKLEQLKVLVKKANRIEKKLGYKKTTLSEGQRYFKNCTLSFIGNLDKKTTIQKNVIDIELYRDNRIHNLENMRYTLLAKLEHFTENFENYVTVLNEEIFNYYTLEELKKLKQNCNHCNTNRKRKYTYIIRDNINHKITQIAKNCLKEYTLIDNIENIVEYFNNITEIEYLTFKEEKEISNKDYSFYIQDNKLYNTLEILTVVKEVLKKHNYISKAQAYHTGEKTTTERVEELLFKKKGSIIIDDNIKENIREFLSYDKKQYYNDYEENDNCFIFKLNKLLTYDFVKYESICYLSSFFKILESIRKKEKRKQEEEQASKKISQLTYKEKDKIELKLTLTNFKTYTSDYYYNSTTTYYYFKDSNNITFLWKSSKIINELKNDTIVNLKGTIKEIQKDKIILTRCKII